MGNIKSIGKDLHIFMCVMAVILASIIINIMLKSGYGMDYFVIGRENYDIMNNAGFAELALVTIFTRIKQFVLVYVIYKLINPDVVYNGIIIFASFVAGCMICIQTFYEGLTGVVELMLFLFPHYIFYFLLVRTIYSQVKRNSKNGTRGILIILVIFISGVICELIFSKIFLNEFYQYMVLK